MRTVTSYCGCLVALILLVGLLPADSYGTETRIETDTILRVFQRDTDSGEDENVLPIYEYLRIDSGELEDFGLSFHFYGWGRADISDSEYYEDQSDGELLYGYLEYSGNANQYGIRFGRQHVFEGVANDTVDGLRLSGNLGDYFSLSVYGGLPVGLDSAEGSDGDSIVGGRVSHHYGSRYEIGISFKTSENDNETAEEIMGVDLDLSLSDAVSLSGFSNYNQDSEEWAEQSWEVRVPLGRVTLKPYFQQFSYDDYFASGANVTSPFELVQEGEELTAYGFDALWQYNDNWTIGGKIKQHDYKLADSAQTYSVLAAWQGEERTQYGAEIGRTSGGDEDINHYTLMHLYGYRGYVKGRLGIDFLSADMLMAAYDEEIYGMDNSLFVSLGAGRHYMGDALALKLSADYSQDPYFDEDLRGTCTLTYNFSK